MLIGLFFCRGITILVIEEVASRILTFAIEIRMADDIDDQGPLPWCSLFEFGFSRHMTALDQNSGEFPCIQFIIICHFMSLSLGKVAIHTI